MCHPEAQAEGSLGTGVPREDKKKNVPREDIPKPHPERSEGCLANARQDRWRGRDVSLLLGRTKMGARQDKKRGLGAKIVKI